MIEQLTYLADEICAGAEIYYSGRQGGHYLKTAFILCDDYSELMSKLYLLCQDVTWTEATGRRFKNFHEVKQDVEGSIEGRLGGEEIDHIKRLHGAMEQRRTRRNGFFHSAELLDLNVSDRMCVESFCDLFDYGKRLFGEPWRRAIAGARHLESYELLLRIELQSLRTPALQTRLMSLLAEWPRNNSQAKRKGLQVAVHPEDLHLRLTVINGGSEFRDRLRALLPEPGL